MSPLEFPRLNDLDLQQFQQLISRESFTWKGQEEKSKLIAILIGQRLAMKRAEIKKELEKAGISSHLAEQEALNRTKTSVNSLTLPAGQEQLLVGKGDHARGVTTQGNAGYVPFNVMIPAHIDTVGIGSHDLLQLHHDPDNTDNVMGRGVYDMLGSVLNSIALITDLQVPEGMNVYFVFPFDEETHSSGAKAVINWKGWKDMDVVLSSEIGHIDQPDRSSMSYILGRRGRQKYHVKLQVQDSAQGHFAEDHIRSATTAMSEADYLIRDRFFYADMTGPEKTQRFHPLFGNEKHQDGAAYSGDPHEQKSSPSREAHLFYNILTVPPRTLEATLLEQEQILADIAERCNWAKHSIEWEVTENELETSYEPFEMPEDHPFSRIVARKLTELCGRARSAYAPSVADENLYATELKLRGPDNQFLPYQGVLSVPIVGDNAHRLDEWASLTSIAQVRHAMRMLIEDKTGLSELMDIKKRWKAEHPH